MQRVRDVVYLELAAIEFASIPHDHFLPAVRTKQLANWLIIDY